MATQSIVQIHSPSTPSPHLVAIASHKPLGSAETQARLLRAAGAPAGSAVARLTWTRAGEVCGVGLELRPADALAAGGELAELFQACLFSGEALRLGAAGVGVGSFHDPKIRACHHVRLASKSVRG